MNNTVYDVDFTRALPDSLKNDSTMLALGRSIAGELQENIRLSRLAIIYARLDELDENVLDILARDLHVDWYEDNTTVEVKRKIIKSSVKVHKKLGTKYALETAIRNIYPIFHVEEWFEYGGRPFCFKILFDITEAKTPLDILQILWAVNFSKRLTAHLDEVIIKQTIDTVEYSVCAESEYISECEIEETEIETDTTEYSVCAESEYISECEIEETEIETATADYSVCAENEYITEEEYTE